jgi:predicted ATPase/DNA-binding SARP family transcriptional activator
MTARLALLGVPTLEHEGRSWALPFERRSQLLALLALRGGWVARSEVAALLWPETTHKQADTNLRKTLFRLNGLPWEGRVLQQGSALAFDGETDVAAFEAALRDERLDDAVRQHRGRLLDAFDDDANEAWTTWLRYERERLQAAWRAAALAWLAGDVAAPAALALSARLLEADPLDEAVLRVHVGWLQRSGQAAAARSACERFAERLAQELGLEPGAELRALRRSLDEPPAPPPAPVPPAVFADPDFIGRDAELRRIASLLGDEGCRLLCLVGPGGVGKTRLARRALQELAPGFTHGGLFVSMEDVVDAAAFGERLARSVVGGGASGSDALAAAIAALQRRPMLIVLDNAEGLAADPQPLQRLLDACPALKLLATSRVRLALAAERSLVVEGLPCPDAEDVDRLEAFDAAHLFARAARRAEPALALATEAPAVVEICRLVDGLPLALELAAAWVRVLPCAAIAAELRRGTELLRTQDAARLPRHASIEQVFDQSWSRLARAEAETLARLTVLRGTFDASAARAVAAAPLALLAALADRSLLHKDGARLRLHPLVQQLAAARLSPAARADAERAHAAHYLQMLARLRREAENGEREALRQLDLEADNSRAAWLHALADAAVQPLTLAAATQALLSHCEHRGRRHEALELARRGAASPAARRHPMLHALLLAACAFQEHRLGRLAEGEATARAALEAAPEDAEPDAQAPALRVLGGCALRLGRLDAARAHYEHALARSRTRGDARGTALALDNLALVDKRQGRYADALRRSLEALQEHRRLRSVADEARCLNNLADLQMMTDDYAAAELQLRAAQALCERHGMPGTLGLVFVNLSFVAEQRGDLDGATACARRALGGLDESGDRVNATATRQQLATLEWRRGDAEAARRELAAAMRDALQIGHPTLQLHGLVVLSDLLRAEDPAAADCVLAFVAAHPSADVPLRQAVQERGAAPQPALRWPDGLALADAAQFVALEAPQAFAGLRRVLHGR